MTNTTTTAITTEKTKRTPRFKRVAKDNIIIGDRDVAIITQVHRHRFLTSAHITALVDGSQQNIVRRLGLLYHAGYLDRPREQISRTAYGQPLVYGLGNKGAAILAEKLDLPRAKVDWTTKNREVGSSFLNLLEDNRIIFPRKGNGFPRKKYFRFEREQEGQCATNWWSHKEFGHNQGANDEMTNLFDGIKNIFSNPKPKSLLRGLIEISNAKNSDIILDFFSGSCPTAHAVLDLNNQDKSKRKFIMVQLPEPCTEDSEAFKVGYKNIAEIGKERIRRVIKKLNDEHPLKNETDQDRGFKVFKLDRSNFKHWQELAPDSKPEKILEQLELHIDHISHKAKQEELLYEILIKAGFTPAEKIETKTIAGKPVFAIADGGLLICLEPEVTKDLIEAVAEARPKQFFCLDSAFKGNDQLKANAVQTFTARNAGQDKAHQIVFKTI